MMVSGALCLLERSNLPDVREITLATQTVANVQYPRNVKMELDGTTSGKSQTDTNYQLNSVCKWF